MLCHNEILLPIYEGIVKKNRTNCRRAGMRYAHKNIPPLSHNKDHKKIRDGAAQEDKFHFISQLHGKISFQCIVLYI
jgi:hypothetical protein